MLFLLLAIVSSALVSIAMRLSTGRVKANIGMLLMNYLMCFALSALYAAPGGLVPAVPSLPGTLGMGTVHGALYLLSFVLFQRSVEKNGVVLSATFMKLGLLVPMVASVLLFGELPGAVQVVGFLVAVAAIVLFNLEKDEGRASIGLLILLLAGGCGDAMSKVFEEWGDTALSDQFLLYTFTAALALCLALMLCKGQRPGKAEVFWGFVVGIPNFFSAKFLLAALGEIPAVIAYPTYSVATMLVITLAGVALLRERLKKRQWAAMGLVLCALALLNL